MPKALLVKTDGTFEEVIIEDHEPNDPKVELDLIGSTDSYLAVLIDGLAVEVPTEGPTEESTEIPSKRSTEEPTDESNDPPKELTLFLLCDVCNDLKNEPMKPLNSFISRYSRATIFGDSIIYLLESSYYQKQLDEKRVDLLLTPDEVGFLLGSLGTRSKNWEDHLREFSDRYLDLSGWHPEPKTKIRTIVDEFPVVDVNDTKEYEFVSCPRDELINDRDFRERFVEVLSKMGMEWDHWDDVSFLEDSFCE